MNRLTNRKDLKVYLTCVFLLVIFFVIDLNLELGVAGGVPYIAVVLVSLWASKPYCEVYLAVICSLLVVLGLYLSPAGGELWKVLLNRFVALFAIWTTAILTRMWKKEKDLLLQNKLLVEKEKQKIYFATIQSSQHILNNLLNQLTFIRMEAEESTNMPKETLELFSEIVKEGTTLMEQLSSVEKINENKIIEAVKPKHTPRQ